MEPSNPKKTTINTYIKNLNSRHRQRLGNLAPVLGTILILSFAVALLPLYLYLKLFNVVYFWVRRQKRVDPKPYFNYDRHKIAHMGFADKIWCEYCEWANGTLQWALAITNEIERRYCPVKNQCDPHCDKVKKWRANFLDYEHTLTDVEGYYENRYLQESELEQ